MSKSVTFRTPQVMTTELDISSATLRRWSDEFAAYLSPEAGATQGRTHRRYTEDDLTTLKMVKEMRSSGMSYEQVRDRLNDQFDVWSDKVSRIPPDDDFDDELFDDETSSETHLVALNGNDASAVEFITSALSSLTENQKSVLNSQAANRELLGVLIQDNFNLKEENNQLRQRLLDVERRLTQIGQEEEWRRESLRQELDAKIMQAQHVASEALTTANQPQEMPDIKAVQSKPGCLGSLFGGGDIKIVTTPGRKNRQETAATANSSVSAPTYPPPNLPPAQSTPPASHPKPFTPPE